MIIDFDNNIVGVGKTSLVLQFTKGEFVESYISTIGVDFVIHLNILLIFKLESEEYKN